MILMIGLAVLGVGGLVAWRLASCPVMRALGVGMGSYADRCKETEVRKADVPTYRPYDPFPPYEPASVRAARQVA